MRNLGETLLYKQMPRGSNLAAARAKRAAKRKTKKLSASAIKEYKRRIRKAEAAAAEEGAAAVAVR